MGLYPYYYKYFSIEQELIFLYYQFLMKCNGSLGIKNGSLGKEDL